jgi:dolichol-phosphate mannosyltransferase
MSKLYILIPCFNEAQNIRHLIPRIALILTDKKYTIVLVDDGSTDDILDVFHHLKNEYPVKLIRHRRNLGLHAALSSGLSFLLKDGNDDDVLITMDGDNTHDPKYLDKMLCEIGKGADIVIASRYIKGGGQLSTPLYRKILSIAVNLILRHITGLKIKDVTSGYRCIKVSVLVKVQRSFGKIISESKGFEASFEILFKSALFAKRIVEIPFYLDYGKKLGKSKMKVITTVVRYLLFFYKVVVWRLKTRNYLFSTY